jgi:hypothetical protein
VIAVDRQPQWRGQPDTLKWRFYTLVGLSVVLHVALTPWAALIGFISWLGLSDPVPVHDLPPITAIPVDLIEEEPGPDPGDPQPAEQAPAIVAPEPKVPPAEAPEAPKTAKQPSKAPPKPGTGEDEENRDAEKGPDKRLGDAVALSGSAGKLADANANVRIKIDTEKVRQQPLGARIGEVLGRVPQWHDFLGPAKLDPIRDIDRILIAGPQLRDSSEVVAVLKYNVDDAAMETAIDSLVQRSSGEWLSGPPKAATAEADGAERIFSFIAPSLVAIVPPSARADALRVRKKGVSFPAIPGDAVLVATIQTPHKVYTGLPFQFPKTLKWIRASVTPAPDGSAVALIEAEDASEADARAHSEWLERSVLTVASPKGWAAAAAKFLYGGSRFLEEVEFHAEGSRINGTLRATPEQLASVLSMVEGVINSWNPKAPASSAVSANSAAPGPSGAPPASVPTDSTAPPRPETPPAPPAAQGPVEPLAEPTSEPRAPAAP